MAGRARTFVKNLSAKRKLSYIPPNGRVVGAGKTVAVPGILETILVLGDSKAFDDYVRDVTLGRISISYDFESSFVHTLKILTTADKDQVPIATSGNGAWTGISISGGALKASSVEVYLNGVRSPVGDGVISKVFYFSKDGGVTAKFFSAIELGDRLYYNGTLNGYDLDTDDRITLLYLESAST